MTDNKGKIKNTAIGLTKRLALIAVMAATITGGKLALAALPNIEIVTLLCGVYGYVFGVLGLAAVVIFVIAETLIWGIGTWFITYLIYWPLVCLVFMLFRRLRIKNRFLLTAAAMVLTLFFGVLSSLVDVGLFSGFLDNFWYRFGIYYTRGIVFYALQLASNAVTFIFAFTPLSSALTKIRNRFFTEQPSRPPLLSTAPTDIGEADRLINSDKNTQPLA